MSKSIVAVPLIVGAIFVSGFASINFYHNIVPPAGINFQTIIRAKTALKAFYPFITQQYDIYLQDQIGKYNQTENIIECLNTAKTGDTVVFHLAGYGGSVESVERIINAVIASKAEVKMIVEAPVYSGHAFLAVAGDTLEVLPLSYMMFHTSSAMNVDCSSQQGYDRGQSNAVHCYKYIEAHLSTFYKLLLEHTSTLTSQEKIDVSNGLDVYINSDQVKERQGAK